jgi:hypothetical protein
MTWTQKAIAKVLGATLPEEAEKAATGIQNAFNKIRIDPVHVPELVDHPENITVDGINGGGN